MLIEDQKLQNLLWLVWKQSYLKHVPFSDTKEHNEEARREKGIAIREELRSKVRASASPLKGKRKWMMADSNIREMTVSPAGNEMTLGIDGVIDYDMEPYKELNLVPCPVTCINVHMRLKGVQNYRILWIQNGEIIEEDNQEKHLRERMREGYEFIQWKIQDDYYEIYEDGMFHLLILIPREDGVCIEILCQDMEVTSEVDKGQEEYLKNFMDWQKI